MKVSGSFCLASILILFFLGSSVSEKVYAYPNTDPGRTLNFAIFWKDTYSICRVKDKAKFQYCKFSTQACWVPKTEIEKLQTNPATKVKFIQRNREERFEDSPIVDIQFGKPNELSQEATSGQGIHHGRCKIIPVNNVETPYSLLHYQIIFDDWNPWDQVKISRKPLSFEPLKIKV